MNEIKIHGIKSLSQIPDYSFYIFIFLIILALVILVSFFYFIYKHFKNKDCERKRSFELLKKMDFNNPKQNAYFITHHARILANTQREKKLLNELIEELSSYKYKKDVDVMKEHTQHMFKIFMESVDVK